MFVVTVVFEIHPEHWAAFVPLMEANAQTSVKEEVGCLQFDVCYDADEPTEVFLYEVYTEAAAFQAHLASPHFRAFDQAVAPMISKKRVRTFDWISRW